MFYGYGNKNYWLFTFNLEMKFNLNGCIKLIDYD